MPDTSDPRNISKGAVYEPIKNAEPYFYIFPP